MSYIHYTTDKYIENGARFKAPYKIAKENIYRGLISTSSPIGSGGGTIVGLIPAIVAIPPSHPQDILFTLTIVVVIPFLFGKKILSPILISIEPSKLIVSGEHPIIPVRETLVNTILSEPVVIETAISLVFLFVTIVNSLLPIQPVNTPSLLKTGK